MRSKAANVTAIIVALLTCPAAAQEVRVQALFEGKALLAVDGGKPRTVRAGETYAGVKLISANSEEAVVSVNGKRQRLKLGEGIYSTASVPSGHVTVTLNSDGSGHFVTSGSINGAAMKFLVDTGATMVSMGLEDARRAGVNYLAGTRGHSQTANGITPVYKVKLSSVRLGDITLNDVDGVVHENNSLPVVLLGMSFLGQLEMRREGKSLTLTKRY
ncbi:MAG: retropepsin-like aspartic protease family protein [Burkholderiales bacterium]